MATLEKGNFPSELDKILKELCSHWEIHDSNNFEISPLTGFTNHLYKLTWPAVKQEDQRQVFVRIYGKRWNVFVDREEEEKTFQLVSQLGRGPKFYGSFPNGRVEEFIQGRTLYSHEFRNPKFSALIAAELWKFHSIDRPGPRDVMIWNRLRNWLRNAKKLCSNEHFDEFSMNNLEEEINFLEKKLPNESQVVGFCHNDLHCFNILFQETTQTLTIIDYEFSGYNPIAYDLANYFVEMTADLYADEPHVTDFNKYPGREEREKFITMYLASAGHAPTKLEVEQLMDDVDKYTLASLLFIALWSIINSVANANNNSFDYLEHARQRFRQYWSRRFKVVDATNNVVDQNNSTDEEQRLGSLEL